ncbi:CHKov1 [Anopheles darlingi]|uniref:CHKov1 n=1 Tax=Anopheles darlingi TaxID=43151 RepID=W5JBU4_ANODA|nr:CHKov1 [Anopheles darlingi]
MAPKPITIPSWMTESFFVDAIATKLGVPEDAFTIEGLDVQAATESGDNFVSVMYRVSVQVTSGVSGERQDISLIVKALPNMGLSEEMITSLNVFPKEIAMYTEVLPAFERLYRERGVEVAFGPRCLKHCSQPTDIIVMEDLKDRGYRMANRREGLDMEHCKKLLRRLAQFHAASAVQYERNGPYDDKFKEGMYAEKSRKMFEQFQKLHDAFMYKTMCEWPNNGRFYAELMKHWGLDMFDALLRIVKADPNHFNVLNHGDMWCNNMMFHYNTENEQLEDIVLVDFQMCMYGSPVIDLNYFIFSSVRGDLRLPEMNYLIYYYYQQLTDCLTLLDYGGRRLTLKELNVDFIEHQLYGLSTSFSILPMCLMEKTDDASIDLMLDQGDAGNAFKQKMYNSSAYVQQMGQIMEHFYNTGAFDINGLGVQRPAGIECDDSIDLPLWLDRQFFEDVVKSKLGELGASTDRIIRSVHVELATKKGDNYASVLYRAKVDVQNQLTGSVERFSAIVKAPPKGVLADHMAYLDFSVRETLVYTRCIPMFEQMYRDKGVNVQFGPRCLKSCQGVPVDVLVLDDLTFSGSRMADRRTGLDQRHTELALDLLAKFHAASAVCADRGKHMPEQLVGPKPIESLKRMSNELFQPMLDSLVQCMATWDLDPGYYADLLAHSKHLMDDVAQAITPRDDRFNVLVHGDLWVNNMVFKYDDSDQPVPSAVTLLDFQMCCWTTPVIDLHSLIFSSVSSDLMLPKLNYFLRFYQERLTDNLVLLGYSKRLPTLQQLHVDFADHLSYGFISALLMMPFVVVPETDADASLDTIIDASSEAGQRFQKEFFNNDQLKAQLKPLIPYFRHRGIPGEAK